MTSTDSPPTFQELPILDLSLADSPETRRQLLSQLHDALFDIGFLYIINHGIPTETITNLTSRLPSLFNLPISTKASLSKLNSPHFLGYSGFAEESTLGEKDLREQFDLATELPEVWVLPKDKEELTTKLKKERDILDRDKLDKPDMTKLYWRLRGGNQWPPEQEMPGFRKVFEDYLAALTKLSTSFVHLIEAAFDIPYGTFDSFFDTTGQFLPPQNRVKLVKYPPGKAGEAVRGQGVGAHKDSSGWLTFLLQTGGPDEEGLEVMNSDGAWIPIPPIPDSFVVNFGNAFEAATAGAVRATVHRVVAPLPTSPARYSIPFFQGLPLNLTVTEIKKYIPKHVKQLRGRLDGREDRQVDERWGERWDELGELQLRKWIRSHRDVGRKWYGDEVCEYYLQV